MKTILKILWFALLVVILQKVISPVITGQHLGTIADKLPFGLGDKGSIKRIFSSTYLYQMIFIVLLFLGLDLISGDLKGVVKGPVKLILNCVIYIVGFFFIFLLFDEFNILFK
jgi:hypothetical protein